MIEMIPSFFSEKLKFTANGEFRAPKYSSKNISLFSPCTGILHSIL